MQTTPLLAGLALGVRVGVAIVTPLLLFLLLGRTLDRVAGTSPLFVLLGVLVSFPLMLLFVLRLVRTSERW